MRYRFSSMVEKEKGAAMNCCYPHCAEPGEAVNFSGFKDAIVHLCRAHATAWDILASKQVTTAKRARKLFEKLFRAWVERPSEVGYGDDGITEI